MRLANCSRCFTLLATISLIIASILPQIVVTHLKGDVNLLGQIKHVDLGIGDGIWKKDICFGKDKPDEAILTRFGLTCEGTSQKASCDANNLDQQETERCNQYSSMQAMITLAIISSIFEIVLTFGSCREIPQVPIFILRSCSVFLLLVAISATSGLIILINDSDMVKDQSFSCSTILQVSLCHDFGISYKLILFGMFCLVISLLTTIFVICSTYLRIAASAVANKVNQEPLLASRQEV